MIIPRIGRSGPPRIELATIAIAFRVTNSVKGPGKTLEIIFLKEKLPWQFMANLEVLLKNFLANRYAAE